MRTPEHIPLSVALARDLADDAGGGRGFRLRRPPGAQACVTPIEITSQALGPLFRRISPLFRRQQRIRANALSKRAVSSLKGPPPPPFGQRSCFCRCYQRDRLNARGEPGRDASPNTRALRMA